MQINICWASYQVKETILSIQKTKQNITVQELYNWRAESDSCIQSSQVPWIIFFQFMKLSFSYKYRFFHRLPPAHCNNKTTFPLFNRDFLHDEKVFQTTLPVRIMQRWEQFILTTTHHHHLRQRHWTGKWAKPWKAI